VAEAISFTSTGRRLGLISAIGTVLLIAVYLVALVAGVFSLSSSDQPIGDPWFSSLEILIILLTPFLVALTVAVHAWAPTETRVFSLLAIVFMAMLAMLTCSVHFVILAVGHQPAFSALDWMPLLLSFKWPSIAYALDILAWNGFFALAVLCAAFVFRGSGLATWIRGLLLLSGVLALAGFSGIAFANMQLRYIGIAGYVGVFPVAALLMAVLFRRTVAQAL
jgi:hypothetical protein